MIAPRRRFESGQFHTRGELGDDALIRAREEGRSLRLEDAAVVVLDEGEPDGGLG